MPGVSVPRYLTYLPYVRLKALFVVRALPTAAARQPKAEVVSLEAN